MSSKNPPILPPSTEAAATLSSSPRDIRDLFSYRLALITRINDRDAQNMLVRQYGITLGEWRTLAVARYLGPTSLRALARQAFMDEGQVSRSVSGLIERGLINRTTGQEDRRSIVLTLTEAGNELHDRVMLFAREMNEDVLSEMTPQERQDLFNLLDKLLAKVHQVFIRGEQTD